MSEQKKNAPNVVDIYLAEPRGFCAGVRRAVSLVEESLKKYGAPVFVRHEIVHNRHVIQELESKGAVFVEELSEADSSRPLIISAHGAGKAVHEQSQQKHKIVIDATCPLVAKIHNEIKKYAQEGKDIIVIGKASHPEIIGTVGQHPNYKKITIINTKEQAETVEVENSDEIAFVSQTTLSVDDTKEIIAILQKRFSKIAGLKRQDICYATTNRQNAVKALAEKAACVLIIGSQNSSNSNQLRHVAQKNGAEFACLINDAQEVDWQKIASFQKIGISAGASAPEHLVDELLKEFAKRYNKINIHHVIIAKENVKFKI